VLLLLLILLLLLLQVLLHELLLVSTERVILLTRHQRGKFSFAAPVGISTAAAAGSARADVARQHLNAGPSTRALFSST
jgi:hypothetical protein